MVDIFVSPGCLKLILTQICRLAGPLQIPLHKLDAHAKPFHSLSEILMLFEVSSDASVGKFEDLFVKDLPMRLIGMHCGAEPMGHWLEEFIVLIDGGFCIYFSDV